MFKSSANQEKEGCRVRIGGISHGKVDARLSLQCFALQRVFPAADFLPSGWKEALCGPAHKIHLISNYDCLPMTWCCPAYSYFVENRATTTRTLAASVCRLNPL